MRSSELMVCGQCGFHLKLKGAFTACRNLSCLFLNHDTNPGDIFSSSFFLPSVTVMWGEVHFLVVPLTFMLLAGFCSWQVNYYLIIFQDKFSKIFIVSNYTSHSFLTIIFTSIGSIFSSPFPCFDVLFLFFVAVLAQVPIPWTLYVFIHRCLSLPPAFSNFISPLNSLFTIFVWLWLSQCEGKLALHLFLFRLSHRQAWILQGQHAVVWWEQQRKRDTSHQCCTSILTDTEKYSLGMDTRELFFQWLATNNEWQSLLVLDQRMFWRAHFPLSTCFS